MSTTTKKDLIDRITEINQVKNTLVKAIIQNFLDEITAELAKGNRLEFRDFGVFEVKERSARKAQNPATLEPIDVPASRTVKFKMGRIMKKKLNTRIVKK
jgi:integration host factor subunit beta